jgi:TRAP-type C4-dicarboxylate transport system substrate-binding protein
MTRHARPGVLCALVASWLAWVIASAAPARAQQVLRLATVAPDGTGWARELKAFAREVEAGSRGQLKLKWYFGAIAGNEREAGERIARGQLDGTGSGGMFCIQVMPSMRVTRIQGVFQSREEAGYALGRLHQMLADEARAAGFTLLGSSGLGPDVVFTKTPVKSLADLKKLRLWRWDLDEVGILMSREIGLEVVPAPVEAAARLLDDGKVDGFLGIPTAALAFQWYTRAHHALDLRMGYLQGCVLVANRAFDRLSVEHQQVLRAAAAKLSVRFDEVGRRADEDLLGGVFAGSGVTVTQPDAAVRAQFFAAARAARERLGARLAPLELIQRVLGLLADYRAEHDR